MIIEMMMMVVIIIFEDNIEDKGDNSNNDHSDGDDNDSIFWLFPSFCRYFWGRKRHWGRYVITRMFCSLRFSNQTQAVMLSNEVIFLSLYFCIKKTNVFGNCIPCIWFPEPLYQVYTAATLARERNISRKSVSSENSESTVEEYTKGTMQNMRMLWCQLPEVSEAHS